MRITRLVSIFPILSALLVSATPDLPSTIHQRSRLSFVDVTEQVGVTAFQQSEKWGGPCIADLDSDGIYDLVLSYHAQFPVQIFWGNPNGTFTEDPFSFRADIHGINVGPRSARTKERILVLNVGGGRGSNPRPPHKFLISPDRSIVNITNSFGLGQGKGRGRMTIFTDLYRRTFARGRRDFGGPDMLVVGFLGNTSDGFMQYGYDNTRGTYDFKDVPGFADERDGRTFPVDIDDDRLMEIISGPSPQIYRLVAPFTFEDVTEEVLGSDKYSDKTTGAIAEIDVDNDGKFELYFARTTAEDLLPIPKGGDFSDVLFTPRDGKLVDISKAAGIPTDTRSVGVTAADFDNDGYVDLFVTLLSGPDMFLMNNGDGTFRRINGGIPKDNGVNGENGLAADLDGDGRVDLVVGQGLKEGGEGPYRVMRNLTPRGANRRWLLVRVGHHPRRAATALHAVVTVKVDGMTMTRRVGSSGHQAGGPSLLDTVHFGLGGFDVVDSVAVRWTVGKKRVRQNVKANQKITFGIA